MNSNRLVTDDSLFARWGRFVVRHRGLVLLGTIAVLVALVTLWRTAGGQYAASFNIPGTESQSALDLLKAGFPQQAGDTATLVFKADGGLTVPETRARIEKVLNDAKSLTGVTAVGSPYDAPERFISRDGRIGTSEVRFDTPAGSEVPKSQASAFLKFVNNAKPDGVIVEASGNVIDTAEQTPPGASESIGIIAAVFILLVAFGSIVAMGLPLATAAVGLLASFAMVGLAANVLSLPSFSSQFASMIGLGVGIDYALFVVTRYREALHQGSSVEESVGQALGTAGKAVAFAGAAVAIAMLGMLFMNIPFVGALGISGAIVVTLAVIVALVLLPALLGYAGTRVDKWRIPLFHATESGDRSSVWYRLAAQIQSRPLVYAIGALVVLLALAFPTLSIHLGSSDNGNAPTTLHSRRAYDLLAEGFGPGYNGPLLAVFDLREAGPQAAQKLQSLQGALAAAPGVAQVSPPIVSPDGLTATMQVTPKTSPQDDATQALVHDLRTTVLPPALANSGVKAYLTGQTAAFIDIGDRIKSRLPIFFGAVIGLSFLLLMAVFRSVVVPLKAAVMNLLSIGASYGVVVAIFQWGWGASILGIKKGPIESFLPMMLFAILFGLSMDYEVFLISRIREEYLRTRKNGESVAHGLAVTARVITAAAAIMTVVFLSFVLGNARVIKEFGIGLSVAIFVDATVVRLFLVPATMELLGDANWWLPRWLDKLLPRLDIEGPALPQPTGAAAD